MINKYSDIPLYSQLKQLIIEKIEKGEYAVDSRIPSEKELCEQYNISRPTVRQAILELTNSGILYKQKGKGTFIAKPKCNIIDIKNYTGFTDSILDSPEPGNKNIISMVEVKSRSISKVNDAFRMFYSHDINFLEIKYLLMKDKEPLSLNVSYLPLNLFPGIAEDIRAKKPSYDILKGKYALIPVRTKSSLEVVYTELEDAQYLNVQPGQPLIKVESLLYSKSGQPIELVISKYRADKCRMVFENSK